MLELFALLVFLAARLFGTAPAEALRLAFLVLLWSQILTAALGLLIKAGFWGLLTLGGVLGGAEEAGAVGALVGVAIVGGSGLWGMLKYVLRKALLIGGLLIVLANPSSLAAGVMYGVGAFWSWKNDWGLLVALKDGFVEGWKKRKG